MNEVIPIEGGWSVVENLQEMVIVFFEIMDYPIICHLYNHIPIICYSYALLYVISHKQVSILLKSLV